MQRRGHVADQDGFETIFVESPGQEGQLGLRIHA